MKGEDGKKPPALPPLDLSVERDNDESLSQAMKSARGSRQVQVCCCCCCCWLFFSFIVCFLQREPSASGMTTARELPDAGEQPPPLPGRLMNCQLLLVVVQLFLY
jgi:hypothetical protein